MSKIERGLLFERGEGLTADKEDGENRGERRSAIPGEKFWSDEVAEIRNGCSRE